MSTILRYASALAIAFALLIFSPVSSLAHAAQAGDPKVDPKTVSVVDAGLGPCTADFIITDAAGAPVYAANIRVHIAYGFMNLHKFDLEVGTNADGKARFIGLPENPKQGLFFRASEADREGSAFDNPSKTCKAQFTVVLRKKAQE
ncbi:MAG: hypothetical protein WBP65_07940 [Candidatus Sulfotelmatobacter sp.]|jgi:hypothetical protein